MAITTIDAKLLQKMFLAGAKKLEAKKEFKKEPFKGVADDDGFVEVKKEEPKAEVKEEKKKFSFFKKK